MSDISVPPVPRPYRVLLEYEGAQQWISVWGYDIHEAALSAGLKLRGEVGSDALKVCEITPDFETYVKLVRGDCS